MALSTVRTDTSENKDPFTCGWLLIQHDLTSSLTLDNLEKCTSVLDGYLLRAPVSLASKLLLVTGLKKT